MQSANITLLIESFQYCGMLGNRVYCEKKSSGINEKHVVAMPKEIVSHCFQELFIAESLLN